MSGEDRLELVKSLLARVLATPASERASFLERECAGDEALRREIEELVRADEAADDFLSRPTTGALGGASPAEKAGDRIGRFRLLEEIGSGGFGTVWLAEQEEPVRRKVALKIIKLGMDTKQVIARFEAERQALALMDHPGIARVLDAGSTETGRPYFVMDLVRGTPVTAYCDAEKLTTTERLALFQQICNAVQHAHQKGVIHRDLKPSNVLVTRHDGVPVPVVIDFGIAKATSARLTERTLFTEFGQFLGTPEYMAPEQAEMSGLDVDTRADIYSLGVLLYELLTGTKPFDLRTLRDKGYEEMLRLIREVDPPKPSTRVSTLGDVGIGVAARRRAAPRQLGRLMRGDLDWIVMKALEKDRRRRYDTATGLADDVGRYLLDEPVLASPPSAAYLARKFVRRHRVGVSAGAIVALALLAGAIGTGVGLVKARRSAADAERRFAMAADGADLLLFTVAHEVARIPGGKDFGLRVLGVAQDFYRRLARENPSDSSIRRGIWVSFQQIGDAYAALGDDAKSAESHAEFRRLVEAGVAAEPENPIFRNDLAVSRERDGLRALHAGDLDAAERILREQLGMLRELAASHPDRPSVRFDLAGALGSLATVMEHRGDLVAIRELRREATALLERVAVERTDGWMWRGALAASHAYLALAESRLGDAEAERRHLDRAIAVMDGVRDAKPPDAPALAVYADALQRRGLAAAMNGDDAGAERDYLKALAALESLARLEPRNPVIVFQRRESNERLGDVALKQGRLDRAKEIYDAMVKDSRSLVASAPDDPTARFNLARACLCVAVYSLTIGETRVGEAHYRESLEIGARLLEEEPRNVNVMSVISESRRGLAGTAVVAGDAPGGMSHVSEAVAVMDRARAIEPENPGLSENLVLALNQKGELARQLGDFPLARDCFARAVEIELRRTPSAPLGTHGSRLLSTLRSNQGSIALALGDLATARESAAAAEALERAAVEKNPADSFSRLMLARARLFVAEIEERAGDFEKAMAALADARELSAKVLESTPDATSARVAFCQANQGIGFGHLRAGDAAGAATAFEDMRAGAERLVALEPENAYHVDLVAIACDGLATAAALRGDAAGTREWRRKSIESLRGVCASERAVPQLLNRFAWICLTAEPEDLRDPKAALGAAERMVAMMGDGDPGALDTLALAHFACGDAARAVETQKRALAVLSPEPGPRRASFEARLAQYEAALGR